MSVYYIAGIIVFLVFVLGSRLLTEKGLKYLSDKEKVALIDSFSSMRKFILVPIIVIVALFFFINTRYPSFYMYSYIIYMALLFALIVAVSIITYTRLKKQDLPQKYINIFVISRVLQYVGVLILFASFFINLKRM